MLADAEGTTEPGRVIDIGSIQIRPGAKRRQRIVVETTKHFAYVCAVGEISNASLKNNDRIVLGEVNGYIFIHSDDPNAKTLRLRILRKFQLRHP
jgi:hypothetical protein